MNSILDGKVYSYQLEEWCVAWESKGEYRHWCSQSHPRNDKVVIVVMLNPGSLSGDGRNLTKDTTLRILREVFYGSGFNPFVINLFDLATPSPDDLFDNWKKRDSNSLIYSAIRGKDFSGILYAYGDYEHSDEYGPEILTRIRLVRDNFSHLTEIVLPKNQNGTPKHPIMWQRQKIKLQIESILKEFYKSTGQLAQ